MHYFFHNFKIKLLCFSLLVVTITVLMFKSTSKDLTAFDCNIGVSLGGIGMSTINTNDSDASSFGTHPKVEASLLKYVSDGYKVSTLFDSMVVGDIIEVPFTNQTTKYPTGCESVSATSVLQYYGIDLSIDSFIDDYLNKAELRIIGYKANNEKIYSSMHPNEYFIGNPKSAYGLGCYEDTIANAIEKVLTDRDLEERFSVTPHDDLTVTDIKYYLDNDVPVIVWATQNLVPSEQGLKWYLGDTKEVFQYMKNEHCMVAIGYDEEYMYFNDSLVGRVAYPIGLLEDRYVQMGSRTVIVEYVG